MGTSLVYRSAVGYELLMRLLYGAHYRDRLRLVALEVPPGAAVLELCCGPGTLYQRHLRGRAGSYLGLDVNERFVTALRRRGVDARIVDLASDQGPLPTADVVLMQASLYHFLPHAERILELMLSAARDRVVISEPVRNLSSSRIGLVGAIGRRAADPGVGEAARRFDADSLADLMSRYRDRLIRSFPIPGGREMVYVVAGQAQDHRPPRRSGTAGGS